MKNFKKAMSMALVATLILTMFACGNKSEATAPASNDAAPAAEVKKVELKLGFENSMSEPVGQGLQKC